MRNKGILSLVFSGFYLSTFLMGCQSSKKISVDETNPSFRTLPEEITKANESIQQSAKSAEYFDNNYVRNSDHSYKKNIKTVQLYPKGQPLSYPLINLGSNESLVLHFDDLNAQTLEYNFRIVHCNADWQPSELIPQDYVQGFTTNTIRSPQFSENTFVEYSHYTYEFPNEDFTLTKSGNYLIHLLESDSIVLTKRFVIIEPKVGISSSVKPATQVKDRDYKQEVDFTIFHPSYQIMDPYQSLNVVIYQNHRLDNAVFGIQPNFVKNDELHYNHEDVNVFEGGNEYRPLDLKNVNYNATMVKEFVVEKDKMFHAYLLADEMRSYKRYTFSEDLNGGFLIKKDDARNSNLEADYINVHFSLPYDYPELNGDIYVLGQLSDRQISDDFKMIYNYEAKAYEKTLLLKQGYYNYLYGYLQDKNKYAELSVVEGTKAETSNLYSIFVYYRQPGDNYDRLIGVENFNPTN